MTDVKFGPTGKVVFDRTYSRTLPDGSKETWRDTVDRVAHGNLAFVHGSNQSEWPKDAFDEYLLLKDYMNDFRIIPAGRHLWATGAPGRQYIFNCHVAGWDDNLSEHFRWTFLRLMEGGGVGGNYSSKYLAPYGLPRRQLDVHIVCDPSHPDYAAMLEAGLLSQIYSADWSGAYAVEDSREGWADALADLIDTFMTDGVVRNVKRVYDVSRVRAKGQPLRTFGGTASGPQPFAEMMRNVGGVLNGAFDCGPGAPGHLTPLEAMTIDHEIGKCVVSGGVRRSARMSLVRWDDPFIFDFIACKRDPSKHWTTNISIEVDDQFIAAINGEKIPNGQTINGWHMNAHAKKVHEAAVKGMLSDGEPGYWNSSLNNRDEPNPTIGCNPCGEVNLQMWEPCCIGHVNLDAFAPTPERPDVDWAGLHEAHGLMTRFLIRATFGDVNDQKQRDVLAVNRRIGVGHFGVQGFLAKCGVKFSEAPDSNFKYDLQSFYRSVRDAARDYAYQLRIPEPVKVTTIAPTGSIAKMPGRTEGIHPVYARHFIRRVRFSTTDLDQIIQVAELEAAGHHVEPDQMAANTVVVEFPTEELLVQEVRDLGLDPEVLVESADEIPLDRMLAFQAMYQEHYCDLAVSFTANIPGESHQLEAMANGDWKIPEPSADYVQEVMATLAEWLPKLKGTTIFIDGARPQAPYHRLTASEWDALDQPKSIADSTDEECANGACPIR